MDDDFDEGAPGGLGGAPTQSQDDSGLLPSDAVAPEAAELDDAAYEGAVCGACGVGDSSSSAPLNFVEDYAGDVEATAPAELPYWRCEFCNIHAPAAVVVDPGRGP